jgi:hypothetical protein
MLMLWCTKCAAVLTPLQRGRSAAGVPELYILINSATAQSTTSALHTARIDSVTLNTARAYVVVLPIHVIRCYISAQHMRLLRRIDVSKHACFKRAKVRS